MRCRRFIIILCIFIMNPLVLPAQDTREQIWVILGEANENWGLHVPNRDKRMDPAQGTLHDGRNEPFHISGLSSRKFGRVTNDFSRLTFDSRSSALYFQVDDEFLYETDIEVYVTVVYYDSGFGLVRLEYDAADTTAPGDPWPEQDPQPDSYNGSVKAGGLITLMNTRRWTEVTFRLPDAHFANRQWYDCDFRLAANQPVFIHEVNLSIKPQPNYIDGNQIARERIQRHLMPVPRLKAGFDIVVPDGRWRDDLIEFDPGWIDIFAQLGVTTFETTIYWADVERNEGVQEWDRYDSLFTRCISAGLKWSIYIPWGTARSTPEWFKKSDDAVFARSIAAEEDGSFLSPWNPALQRHADRFMNAMGQRYGGKGLVRSVILGPHGETGSSSFSLVQKGPGDGEERQNPGWWCGDPLAVRDFQYFLRSRFQKIETLNKAWNSIFFSFDNIRPFSPARAPSWKAIADFAEWYTNIIDRWNIRWVQRARTNFPGAEVYLSVDGESMPAVEGRLSSQLKSIPRTTGGARLAAGSENFRSIFPRAGLLISAARVLGNRIGMEYTDYNPEPSSLSSLFFSTAGFSIPSSQSVKIHPSVFCRPELQEYYRSNVHLLKPGEESMEPIVDMAVLYPWTWFAVTDARGPEDYGPGKAFWKIAGALRDIADFDFIDTILIEEGGLNKYRFIVMPAGTVWDENTIRSLFDWLERGGILIAPELGTIMTVNEDEKYSSILFSRKGMSVSDKRLTDALNYQVKSVNQGYAIQYPASGLISGSEGDSTVVNPEFLRTVDQVIHETSRIDEKYTDGVRLDGEMDGVYTVRVRSGVVYYNDTNESVEKSIRMPGQPEPIIVTVPSRTITQQQIQ